MLSKIWGIMFKPTATWREIGEMSESQLNWYLLYPVILGLLPALAWYYGTTQIGWTVAGNSPTRLTPESAAGM
ncbi:MAG: Yip1 family protein, partial [Pseudomonadales bacterium]